MQVDKYLLIDLALRLLFIDLHFFMATIQIGVIVPSMLHTSGSVAQ